MGNNQKPKTGTQAKKDESIFVVRMVGVIEQQAVFISEDRLPLVERDTMLSFIQSMFLLIPFKANLRHNDSVNTL